MMLTRALIKSIHILTDIYAIVHRLLTGISVLLDSAQFLF
jgi:hypothetical protein